MESKSKTKVKKKKQSPPKTEPLVKQEIKIEVSSFM